jgi:hypothetical protein
MSLKGLKGPEGFLAFLAKISQQSIYHFQFSNGYDLLYQKKLATVLLHPSLKIPILLYFLKLATMNTTISGIEE